MAYDHLTVYTAGKADRFVADNGDEVIYRSDYYNRPSNLEMLGRIMPEYARVLVEAYNHTPDQIARAVLCCGYCCDQIACGDITPYEAWQQAYRGARYLHQLAADILADGFIYDASTDRVEAAKPSGNYGYSSYGVTVHIFNAMCSVAWIEAMYECQRKQYESERRERIYQESCMRRTHTHYR